MTSIHAKINLTTPAKRRVVFVVYPNFVLLDLSGPLQVFTHAQADGADTPAYHPVIVSLEGGSVASNTVFPIPTTSIEELLDEDVHTLIVVGGDGAYTAMRDPALIKAMSHIANRAHRACSVCSGALVLAATGLLDGRRAVTHWEDCDNLARLFPKVLVEEDPIFVQDGRFWTSAGVTAGIDMALAIVAEDLGRPAALRMAQSIIVPIVRSGGQSQFSPALGQQIRDASGRFEALHAWIADNLADDLTVDTLADVAGMSARNFSRLYTSEMGTTPAKAVEVLRTDAARDLLETTDLGVKEIAARSGFRDDERLRRAFERQLKTSPSEYRSRFQGPV